MDKFGYKGEDNENTLKKYFKYNYFSQKMSDSNQLA